MDKPVFGQFVMVKALLQTSRINSVPERKIWERVELPEAKKALYIGERTVYAGLIHITWEDNFAYSEFERETSLTVALIVFDGRHNPVYVSYEDIESLARPTIVT